MIITAPAFSSDIASVGLSVHRKSWARRSQRTSHAPLTARHWNTRAGGRPWQVSRMLMSLARAWHGQLCARRVDRAVREIHCEGQRPRGRDGESQHEDLRTASASPLDRPRSGASPGLGSRRTMREKQLRLRNLSCRLTATSTQATSERSLLAMVTQAIRPGSMEPAQNRKEERR